LVDREVFDRRLNRLEQLLAQLRSAAGRDRETYRSDDLLRASTERWLQVASECVLDLTNHLIADRGWKTPETYREAFQILEQHGVLDHELARQMEGWAGLRNVLVHVYLEVDHNRLYDIITQELDQLERFAAAVAKAAERE